MAQAGHSSDVISGFDAPLFLCVLFLTGVGIVMIYSASSAIANDTYGNGYFFLRKQTLFSVLGGLVLFVASMVPYRIYRPLAYLMLALAAVFLALTQIPGYGHSAGGAARWIKVGGFTVQPSEFARLAMIIYLAYSLSKKEARIREFSIGFLPHVLVMLMLGCLIMVQPDFGSVAILGLICWIMMFLAGVPMKFLAGSLLALLPLAGGIMISASYRVERLMSFLDPWKHQTDQGYQIVHSLMAFGSGGILGKGLGNGHQKLFYLPEPHTDFIFSVIGEELGLWGVLLLLTLFAVILWRGLIIAMNTEDRFGSLLAAGLTLSIGVQVTINMGVAMGLLPTKGLTLPFLSYGGSSLLINMLAVGIILNIGKGCHGRT
jgi:cell division protein FtsW